MNKSTKNKSKMNKSKKNKNQFIILDSDPIVKNDFRVIKNRKNYSKKSCFGLNKLSDLQRRLKLYRNRICNKGFNKCKKQDFYIIPYCNESIKDYMDKINSSSISKLVLNEFREIYNIDFIIDKRYIKEQKKEKLFVGPSNCSHLFLNYLFKIPNMEGRAMLIVTHSSFLATFTQYLSNLCKESELINDPIYDNLDILQLTLYDHNIKNENSIGDCAIRRWSNQYKINPIKKDYIIKRLNRESKKSLNNKSKTFFLMRHCVACHNYPTISITDKKLNNGFGQWSMCFPQTINEMREVKYPLNKLFDKWGGINQIKFGSSVIFRAILTGILLFEVLNN